MQPLLRAGTQHFWTAHFSAIIRKSQLARSVDPESQTIGRLLHNVASNMSLLPKSGYGWTDALIVQASIKSTSTHIHTSGISPQYYCIKSLYVAWFILYTNIKKFKSTLHRSSLIPHNLEFIIISFIFSINVPPKRVIILNLRGKWIFYNRDFHASCARVVVAFLCCSFIFSSFFCSPHGYLCRHWKCNGVWIILRRKTSNVKT